MGSATFRADLLHQRDRRLNRLARGLIAAAAGVALLALVGVAQAWRHYLGDLPRVPPNAELAAYGRAPGMTFLDRNGQVVATRGPKYGRQVKLSELPPYVPLAFLAAEDRRFRSHSGVDLKGVARAALVNAKAGETREGASTLTQQLVRDLFLTSERSFKRKLQEVILAFVLERRLSKDELLELYLNRVFLGENAFGIDAAAHTYFGKSAQQLSLAEAAVLAGLPQAPSVLNPTRNPKGALKRGRLVLERMQDEGWINRGQARVATLQQIIVVPHKGEGDLAWVIDVAAAEARKRAQGRAGDLVVRLTVDPRLQGVAAQTVREALQARGPDAGVSQAALVALGPGGAVRALVGGRDHDTSAFNRAVQARRQPGSAFKPFVWAAALEAGAQPTDIRSTAPVAFGLWTPTESASVGPEISLEDALAVSSNTVAARLTAEVGPERVADVARRFGIVGLPDRPKLPIALGAYETTLWDLTGAYQAFPQGGRRTPPYLVEEVDRSDGVVLWRHGAPAPLVVFDAARAGSMVRMMTGVVTHGTGKRAAFGRPAAGKTGTSQNNRDAWFVGFTPDQVAGVWVGNDDGRPMNGVVGGDLPAEIWRRFMEAASRDEPMLEFDAVRAAGGGRGDFYAGLAAEFARAAETR
ncbi:transglycosylase domain-containing protein [Caulobacter sp. 17J80-11]|uniref:transglycosylase domain-containing protein n=1 Tax=Caulobacter sp. 17J80-11 TaxID=2763502 RepID=UPI0016535BE1|nr:PBP1A family penicillin-binding protein [Caulobacter sp. 17J80-11]MBC6980945.1 PBP1A family penicillin-binding protein [Caulobacter sp. 17J80-11]